MELNTFTLLLIWGGGNFVLIAVALALLIRGQRKPKEVVNTVTLPPKIIYTSKKRSPITEEIKQRIHAGLAAGKTAQCIADELGIMYHQVCGYRRDHFRPQKERSVIHSAVTGAKIVRKRKKDEPRGLTIEQKQEIVKLLDLKVKPKAIAATIHLPVKKIRNFIGHYRAGKSLI